MPHIRLARCHSVTNKTTIRAAVAVLLLLSPWFAGAQAWLPEQGTFSWSVVYNSVLNKKHYLPDGDEVDVGHTQTHSIGLIASYALTDRWTVAGGIPYVRSKYDGARPHPTHVDDGDYHTSFTDFRLELHFQALEEPVALAPYVAVILPSHDYETLGHAAPGRGLNEQWLGFFVGKSLDPWLARTYVQARYNYAFVEKVAGISHDRSNADLELGYFPTERWSLRAVVLWQDTHGGIDVPVPPSHPLFDHHDQIAEESFLNVGAGLACSLTDRIDIHALYLTSVSGKNGHKLDTGLTVGLSYRVAPN